MIPLKRPVDKISALRVWVGFVGVLSLMAAVHSFVNQRAEFVRTYIYDLQPSEGELIH